MGMFQSIFWRPPDGLELRGIGKRRKQMAILPKLLS
jgi:hypothetical protein